MFGTVARLTVKPGKTAELQALGDEWTQARGMSTGQVAEYIFKLEGRENELMLVAIFKDRDAYYTNAKDPETDRWYRQMRELLAADPEWNDGEIIDSNVVTAARG
jgi:quinol monooxygenase YgiN